MNGKNRFPILIRQFFCHRQGLLFIPAMSRLELCCFAVLGRVKIKHTFEIGSFGHQKQKQVCQWRCYLLDTLNAVVSHSLEKVVKNPWTGRLIKNALSSATATGRLQLPAQPSPVICVHADPGKQKKIIFFSPLTCSMQAYRLIQWLNLDNESNWMVAAHGKKLWIFFRTENSCCLSRPSDVAKKHRKM